MKKLLLILIIIQFIIIAILCVRVEFIDTRLYSFEAYFFAPYSTDYEATTAILAHLSKKDRARVEAIRKIAKK